LVNSGRPWKIRKVIKTIIKVVIEMGKFITITPESALDLIEKEPEIAILDIRPEEDFVKEHIPGAVNLDYDGHQFQSKVEKLDKTRPYIIYCKSGVRGGYFMEKMLESGFIGAYNILGGFVAWKISKLPLTSD
jgi:rhodanese-related sulfurtransferase